ncbi:MAG: hypothetical protein ND895_19395 [Pyrinomonadaceae bacterium]|nr:hypothetical protein [Pyrinomonadaceae bacterium]
MDKMSKKLYAGIFSVSLGLLLIFGSLALVAAALQNFVWFQDQPGLGVQLLVILGVLSFVQFLFVQVIYTFVVLWKMWGSIQDGHARTTPGKAIGFLFIPFFSVYWIFQVWGGFPRDYNNYVDRRGLAVPHLSSGVFTAYPVLMLLTAIPFLGILIALINMFLFVAIISKTCDAVNALAEGTPERWGHPAQQDAAPKFMVASR